ncbi:repressor of the inhibitor of the protein kinase [Araneus ventricosus]|uniref:Repressor of the inhibitor of the protein kinase n=1 Tax=Araneus ventricosus TaxID=182803 RepID=A0A4Y2J5V3_ARAVE|nr:repressor of the inhibitor of the protein kinase [Araneus ventricosus]
MSAKRTEILKSMISDYCPEQKKNKLISLCETRWVESHDSVFLFKDILEPILLSLLIIEEESSDSAPKAHVLIKEIAAKLDIKEEIPRVYRLQTARNNVPYSTEEEYYRRAVYVPYFDDFCNSLNERFESHKETVASLQHILPEFCTKTDFYSLEAAFNFYEEYFSHKEVVQSEFMSWKEKWSQEKSENLPETAISSLEKCDKTFFPNIYILLKLLAVVPVSVATVESSFSSLRRLKTYLRNTTSESRLNGLALLSIHRDIKIRDEEVLDKFASVPRNLDFVL